MASIAVPLRCLYACHRNIGISTNHVTLHGLIFIFVTHIVVGRRSFIRLLGDSIGIR